ncbi:unnamed protein product [Adineta steineri]|uniref:Uncharacterized protein n=1 Tax=Adineta steineri TaxID=433720 RepID=A0A814ANV0_9BILA|nr:unnamed protein product [Adineta steineri]CAF0982479.1 unnamed protein product [Adineta steineri]
MLGSMFYIERQVNKEEEEERKKRRRRLGGGWLWCCCCCCGISGALIVAGAIILSLIPTYLSDNTVALNSSQFYNIYSVTYGTNYQGNNSVKLANTSSLIPTLENAYSLTNDISAIVSFQFSNSIGTSTTGRKKRLFDLKQCTKNSLLSGYQMNIKFRILIPKRYSSDASRTQYKTNVQNTIQNNYKRLTLVTVFDNGKTASIDMDFCAVEQISNSSYSDPDTTTTTTLTSTTTFTTITTTTTITTSTTGTTTTATTSTTSTTTTTSPVVMTSTCTFNVMRIYSSAGIATSDTTLYPATCDSFCSGSFDSRAPAAIIVSNAAGYTPTITANAPRLGVSCVPNYGNYEIGDGEFIISNTLTSPTATIPPDAPCASPYDTSYCCCTPIAGWSRTGDMHHVRYVHKAVLLHNKNVLVIGGADSVGLNRINNILQSAELYNPSSKTWKLTSNMNILRVGHAVATIANGSILVISGYNGSAFTNSAELYDPSTETWTLTGSVRFARDGFTASILTNGKVLITGGFDYDYNILKSAEIYDPSTGVWTTTGSMNIGRDCHQACVLANGKVLVMGGHGNPEAINSSELYDPLTGIWTLTGSMNFARVFHTATKLPNGKILVAGGMGNNILQSAELYDPSTGIWTTTRNMTSQRTSHAEVLLQNGKVLVVGGSGNGAALNSTELYDPSKETWTLAGDMNHTREYHTATLLTDGKVLVAGGSYEVTHFLNTAEIYDSSATSSTIADEIDHTLEKYNVI